MRGIAVGIALAAWTACAARIVPLVSTDEIAGAFLLQQHLLVTRPDGAATELDAAVQNGCGALVLMALTPFQTPSFVVRQHGSRIEASLTAGIALPFDPARILVDLERTYFVPIGDPPTEARRDVRWRGERIEETWSGGRLVERRFAHGGREQVRITYPDGMRPGELPPHASLEYAATGHRIDVTTVSRTEIHCAP